MGNSPLGVILEFGADSTGAQQDVVKLQSKIQTMSTESAQSVERFSQRGIAAYEEVAARVHQDGPADSGAALATGIEPAGSRAA